MILEGFFEKFGGRENTNKTGWPEFLTIPNPDIVGISALDPLGLQAIWVPFGQKIFGSRITTISNDIRNYTVNLINHYSIYRFKTEYHEVFEEVRKSFKGFKTEYDVKTGLLIFLEDLYAHTIFQSSQENLMDVDKIGVLGIFNAEKVHSKKDEAIFLKANRSKGLLINQISLGVNGRYKGPFINMGFFDRMLHYEPQTWEKVGQLISTSPSLKALSDRYVDLLVGLTESKGTEYPTVEFDEIYGDEVTTLLIGEALGKRVVSKSVKVFWIEMLGLDTGAARSIYQAITDNPNISAEAAFNLALNTSETELDKAKIRDIIVLEPFLSVTQQIFLHLTSKEVKNLAEIEKKVGTLISHYQLDKVKSIKANGPRLSKLFDAVEAGLSDPIEMLRSLSDYHKEIMSSRKTSPWVEVAKDNKIKHYIFQEPMDDDRYSDSVAWYHTYYTDSLKSIQKGLA